MLLEFNSGVDFQSYTNTPQQMLIPNHYEEDPKTNDEFEEPPLLEELEIYPDRILEKVLAVLNPFRAHSLADDAEYLTKESDLAGPVLFCLTLAVSLFLAGKSFHFGYIYGMSVISTLFIYCLLSLMTLENNLFTLSTVGSILGKFLLNL